MSCPCCKVSEAGHITCDEHVYAIRDRYPVNPGHTLIIPFRHVATWFDASAEEQRAILSMIERVKADLDEKHEPDGYNVGFNVGEVAGQTVMHLHVHVIPRYSGDVDDPCGGVRLVIPDRGNYRRKGFVPRSGKPRTRDPESHRTERLSIGGTTDPFFEHMKPLFARASHIDILAAFVQESGVLHLEGRIWSALDRGANVRILTGDYLNITQARALKRLLDMVHGEVVVEIEEDEERDGCTTERGYLDVRVVEMSVVSRLRGGPRGMKRAEPGGHR